MVLRRQRIIVDIVCRMAGEDHLPCGRIPHYIWTRAGVKAVVGCDGISHIERRPPSGSIRRDLHIYPAVGQAAILIAQDVLPVIHLCHGRHSGTMSLAGTSSDDPGLAPIVTAVVRSGHGYHLAPIGMHKLIREHNHKPVLTIQEEKRHPDPILDCPTARPFSSRTPCLPV
jgi:hypothetical protein